jgi:hypothetical protein
MVNDNAIYYQNTELNDKNYTILVYQYLYGQYRIHICDKRLKDSGAPPGHGEIIRELDTYKVEKLWSVITDIINAEELLKFINSLATEKNTKGSITTGRIRLDDE